MRDGRGWHHYSYEHGLAARGIKTTQKKLSPSKEMSVHDRIFRMARENTGSHFLDSGMAYGYGYNRPIAPRTIYLTEDKTFRISTPHWLNEMLDEDETSDRLNTILEHIRKEGNEDQNREFKDDMEEFFEYAKKNEDEYEFVTEDNTYNSDNDFDQDFLFRLFHIDGEAYVMLQTHNGCDIRGGYSEPYVFRVVDEDYFFDWQISLNAIPINEGNTVQTTLHSKKIEPCDVYYGNLYEYDHDLEDSPYRKKIEKPEDMIDKDEHLFCPKCGRYHLAPYNAGEGF